MAVFLGNLDYDSGAYNLKWMSNMLRSKSKQDAALLWQSAPGAGKSVVHELIKEVMGSAYHKTISKIEELVGNFNSHIAQAVCILSEEATFGGDRKTGSTLKDVITRPEFNVHMKFRPIFTIKSRHNFCFCSNHYWVVPVDAGDRRFACFHCNDLFTGGCAVTQAPPTREYFRLLRETHPYALAYFHYFLDDLTWFNPRDYPNNEAGNAQKIASFDSLHLFLLDFLTPFAQLDLVAAQDKWENLGCAGMEVMAFYDRYRTWMDDNKIYDHFKRIPPTQFRRTLVHELALETKRPRVDAHRPVVAKFPPRVDAVLFHFLRSQGMAAWPSDASPQDRPQDQQIALAETLVDEFLASLTLPPPPPPPPPSLSPHKLDAVTTLLFSLLPDPPLPDPPLPPTAPSPTAPSPTAPPPSPLTPESPYIPLPLQFDAQPMDFEWSTMDQQPWIDFASDDEELDLK